MKVWEARLTLTNDEKGNWLAYFDFESDGRDYTLIGDSYCESKRGWVRNQIPANIEITQHYGVLRAIQGFEMALDETELKVLEQTMKNVLIERIEYEKAQYLENFEKKLNVLSV